ncbi:hypothetical protein [Streptomyces sp. WM6386]|uniref:hypothetical protein n=1 Tax=Streptomyces sp. WM6386 TaxID=1415558 RepID=UPI000619EAF5|nr:hypothetical protein [Streptomyces sp. WM6386]KKD09821.1 hypothetical protein TN53_00535 [Streptomyces sp. WM6386]
MLRGRVLHLELARSGKDWSKTIRSGRIQPACEADAVVEPPPRLAVLAQAWGYPIVRLSR